MTNRPKGYYWLQRKMSDGRWIVGEWWNGKWLLTDNPAHFADSDFLTIGPKIEPPLKIDPILNRLDDDGETH
jgi:hypothetical protein